ncbi:metal-dependent hydrolase [Natrarchaeobius halalkaliphilus]|uniref:Metal-dependent hydrolase n=1 Tax=Natrarchaeobius halalkaliphilus TaxID=1679091 RepID=A0A3N6LS92_9EURY|nr:metal-dependent hydrolase [Natrarchaeobius halalkaliphilus]RQG90124.1 metal-dependent hydrolase [Natrarchaeobius halalkaliphilus]
MQPVVHLIIGYLCYAVYTRWQRDEVPTDRGALVAIVAAALPDLVDKPLAAAGVVPVGRTVGHSLLVVVPVTLAVWLAADRYGRRTLGTAFAIGLLSHVVTDVPWHVLSGEFHELGFLLWPITEMPSYIGIKPLGTVPILGVEATTLWLEAVIFVVGVALWIRDGKPGFDPIAERLLR